MRVNPLAENEPSLAGLRVLVVEDDYFIAEEICSALREQGAQIVGPSPDIVRGLQLVRSSLIDCAVLDINLQGELAFVIAKELRRRGTPAIFATGYGISVMPGEFSSHVRLEKPVNLRALVQAVQSACARKRPRQRC